MNTIAAISTPICQGGIGIIRISGEKALEIIQKIFKYKNKNNGLKSYTMRYGYIFDNDDIIQGFTNAIYKAQQWVKTHSAREIAEVIHPHFSDLSLEDLTIVMQRHIDIDACFDTPLLKGESLDKLMDVMIEAN